MLLAEVDVATVGVVVTAGAGLTSFGVEDDVIFFEMDWINDHPCSP